MARHMLLEHRKSTAAEGRGVLAMVALVVIGDVIRTRLPAAGQIDG